MYLIRKVQPTRHAFAQADQAHRETFSRFEGVRESTRLDCLQILTARRLCSPGLSRCREFSREPLLWNRDDEFTRRRLNVADQRALPRGVTYPIYA